LREPRSWQESPKPLHRWKPPPDPNATTDVQVVEQLPSSLAVKIIRLRDGGGMPFTFTRRPYLYPLYDRWHKRMVVIGGRQIEKSSFLSNMMLLPAVAQLDGLRGFRTLYVAPTDKHTRTFAYDKLDGTLRASPLLRELLGKEVVDNLYHKEFSNGSSVLLRSAYLTADSARGIPSDQLLVDEAQEMIPSHLPVLQETLTHSHHDRFGRRILITGTANTPDCLIGSYWADYSTQGEWVTRCPKGHENIMEIENIGTTGPICSKCQQNLNVLEGQWVHQAPGKKDMYIGYRIPQVINPMVLDHWDELYNKLKTYSNARISNEILGRSYELGVKPITTSDLRRAANRLPMSVDQQYIPQPIMGVDWGYGDISYTVVTIGGWNQHGKFQVIFCKRFKVGHEVNPLYQVRYILEIAKKFRVVFMGLDFGAGWSQNTRIRTDFPKCSEFVYAHGQKALIKWNRNLKKYIVSRTESMTHLFEAMKSQTIEVFEGYVEEFGQDFLNVAVATDKLGRILYTHSPLRPDDAIHSLNYCFLVARMMRKDIQIIHNDQLEDEDDFI